MKALTGPTLLLIQAQYIIPLKWPYLHFNSTYFCPKTRPSASLDPQDPLLWIHPHILMGLGCWGQRQGGHFLFWCCCPQTLNPLKKGEMFTIHVTERQLETKYNAVSGQPDTLRRIYMLKTDFKNSIWPESEEKLIFNSCFKGERNHRRMSLRTAFGWFALLCSRN